MNPQKIAGIHQPCSIIKMVSTITQDKNDYKVHLPGDVDLEMVKVEGGTFMMGSEEYDGTKPVHEVSVPDFHIGKYPVTVRQYLAFVKDTGNHHPEWMEEGSAYNIKTGSDNHYKRLGKALTHADHPIVGVSWEDAVAFCRWLSRECYGTDFRLPSEAEWEYAARGGKYNQGLPYAGSSNLKEVAWYYKNSNGQTQPVGLKLPNELGIYDMSGNADEWCADNLYSNYEGAPADGSAWIKRRYDERQVLRGGSWNFDKSSCRVSYRGWYYNSSPFAGFRLARRGHK